ncbi:uncharacterized protein [Rutidosis leptorrhynchoides]|uniref:uncharacterized protein n=1 Tax=Rutidosis leptorrhynchoides TaxID=125765 RepID=UPI003A998EC6
MEGGVESATWNWRREISGRVSRGFESLINMISNVSLDRNNKDKVKWSMASNGAFKVSTLTAAIDDIILDEFTAQQGTIRNKLIPKKLEIFVWRAAKKRLHVRVKLDKRGIDLHIVRCPLCDDGLETVEHALIFCKHAIEVWDRIFKLWNMGSFNNFTINELLMKNNHSSSMSSLGNSIWLAIKWIGAYFIWKNRNNKVFRDKNWNPPVTFNEIQTISFDWISNRARGRKVDWQSWISNPVVYLSLV